MIMVTSRATKAVMKPLAEVTAKLLAAGAGGMLLAVGMISSAPAAHWYVRPTQQGSNNGSDWLNAWTLSTVNWSTVQPGDTLWLAGGDYESVLSPGRNGSKGGPITIMRVRSTNAEPVSAAGWDPSFDSLVTIPSGWSLAGRSFITIDGQIRYGIRVPSGGGRAISFHNGSTTVSDSIQLKNIEVAGPGFRAMGANQLLYAANYNGSGNTTIRNLLISHCSFHDAVMLITLAAVTNGVIEHCELYNCSSGDLAAWHPDVVYFYPSTNIIFRYNMVSNTVAEALWFDYGGSREIFFYGNTLNKGAQGTGFCIGTKSTYSWGPMYIYNNTFIGYDAGGVLLRGVSDPKTTVQNNIFWNSVNACQIGGAVNSDYNAYSGSIPSGETHSLSSSVNPFVSSATGDFRLVPGAWVANRGIALERDGFLDRDPLGSPRGADGLWDIGAFEFAEGGAANNPLISVTPSEIDFGSLAKGSSATNVLLVRNRGGGTLSGAASVAAPFAVVTGASYTLTSNQTHAVTVTFSPASAGDFNGSLQFTGGGGASAALSGAAWEVLPGLTFLSTAGTVSPPFVAGSGYISQPLETGLAGSGRAVYGFTIPTAGNYIIVASVNAPHEGANSFYINIDGEPVDPGMIWDVPITSGFTNLEVCWRGDGTESSNQYAPAVFTLSSGTHFVVVRGRESGAQLASLTIAPSGAHRPAPPIVSPVVQSPADSNADAPGVQVLAGTSVQYTGSASDASGLPLIWQWLYTMNGSPETLHASGSGVVAPATFSYPAQSAGSTYVWKLRVSNGQTSAEALLNVLVESPSLPLHSLIFEAEAGLISAPFAVTNGSISQPMETGLSSGGRAVYAFEITEPGIYAIQALINAPTDAANSLFFNVDAEPQDPFMIWDIPVTSGFEWRTAAWRGNGTFDKSEFVQKSFSLSQGTHRLVIIGREPKLAIDRIRVCKLPEGTPRIWVVNAL